MCDRQSCTMCSLNRDFASRLNILLSEHHLEFLSLNDDCIGSSDSTLVKMPHYWKSQSCRGSFVYSRVQGLLTDDVLFHFD